jgi:hypothetical protein
MWQGELKNHMAQGTALFKQLKTISHNNKSQHPDQDMLALTFPMHLLSEHGRQHSFECYPSTAFHNLAVLEKAIRRSIFINA